MKKYLSESPKFYKDFILKYTFLEKIYGIETLVGWSSCVFFFNHAIIFPEPKVIRKYFPLYGLIIPLIYVI